MVFRKLILFVILSWSFFTIQAQDFIVSDITFKIEDKDEILRIKKEMLGAEVKMTIYDSSLKMILTTNLNVREEKIFDKSPSDSNIYVYNGRSFKITLTLNTIFNYISSAKINTESEDYTFILKRK